MRRVHELSEEQARSLFHVSSWTFSGLHQTRTKYAASYLRRASRHFAPARSAELLGAAALYEQVRTRLGPWDASDPRFGMVKQKPIDTWTVEVRRREVELLLDVARLEEGAMASIERALAPA